MNYSGINFCDTANGPGVRVSLFVSGCSLHCKGCFNKEAWDRQFGKPFTDETLNTLLEALREPYVDGLSLLGGDPLEPYNEALLERICSLVRDRFPDKTIWLWTGRKYEEVKDKPIMKYVDVLVDGPFIEKFKTNEQGKYYGSSNQRVITIYREHE